MNKTRIWLGLLIMLLAVGIPAASAQNDLTGMTLDRLKLRAGPGTAYEVIAILAYHTPLRLEGRNTLGDWLLAHTEAGEQGWVSARYVGLDKGMISDIPVVAANPALPVTPGESTPGTDIPGTRRIVIGPSHVPITAPLVNLTDSELNIMLHWNSTANLDLHIVEPGGFVVEPGSGASPSGGYLNIPGGVNNDCNDRDAAAIEVVDWKMGHAPLGTYRITVNFANNCFAGEDETLFWVAVKDNGPQVEFWVFYIKPGDIYEFTYTYAGNRWPSP